MGEGRVAARVIKVPLMLSVRNVSARLRKRRAEVYRLCTSRAFPGAYRDGRAWRIPEPDVLAWVERQREATAGRLASLDAREERLAEGRQPPGPTCRGCGWPANVPGPDTDGGGRRCGTCGAMRPTVGVAA